MSIVNHHNQVFFFYNEKLYRYDIENKDLTDIKINNLALSEKRIGAAIVSNNNDKLFILGGNFASDYSLLQENYFFSTNHTLKTSKQFQMITIDNNSNSNINDNNTKYTLNTLKSLPNKSNCIRKHACYNLIKDEINVISKFDSTDLMLSTFNFTKDKWYDYKQYFSSQAINYNYNRKIIEFWYDEINCNILYFLIETNRVVWLDLRESKQWKMLWDAFHFA